MAKIIIDLDTRIDSLDKVFGELGFVRASGVEPAKPDSSTSVHPKDAARFAAILAAQNAVKAVEAMSDALDGVSKSCDTEIEEIRGAIVAAGEEMVKPELLTEMDGDRKRGEAGAGRKRRTAEQVESDHAYFAQKTRAEAALAAMDKGVETAPVHPEVLKMAGVSSGEARVNPEDAAQDAADEAAETAARAAGPLTLEHLRAAVAHYTEKFGAAATVQNIRAIIGCPISDVPADKIAAAIAAVEMATSGSKIIAPNSPKDGSPNPDAGLGLLDEPPTAAAPVTATKAEVVGAMKNYGRKFDGSDDAAKMLFTKEDLPKVFAQTFGAGVTGLGSIPDDKPETFGKILTAIRQATEQNPFKREVRS